MTECMCLLISLISVNESLKGHKIGPNANLEPMSRQPNTSYFISQINVRNLPCFSIVLKQLQFIWFKIYFNLN